MTLLYDITIDPEFQEWIVPLSQEEFSRLEASLIEEGCRDPLVVWNGIIVDGHHRYEICQRHGIPFKTVDKEFTDKDDAKIWMFNNQIARRNLTPYQRAELALKVEPLLSAKARQRQLSTLKQGDKNPDTPTLAEREKGETRQQLAGIARISHGSLDKVRKIVEKAPEEIKKKLRAGETTINAEYNKIHNEEVLQTRREELKSKMSAAAKIPDTIQLYAGNFLTDYKKLIPENSIDAIITDPPYVKEWLPNYSAFAKAAAYVLKPGGFLIAYIGHIHLDIILKMMTPKKKEIVFDGESTYEVDVILNQEPKYLEYYWIAMLLHSGTNAAVHSRSTQCGMKPILILNKPPRTKSKRYFNDVIRGTGKEKDAHKWQQGEEELIQIFEPFTDPGDMVLDPFMGSGTVIRMAKKLNRRAIGIDIMEENVDVVRGWLVEEPNVLQ